MALIKYHNGRLSSRLQSCWRQKAGARVSLQGMGPRYLPMNRGSLFPRNAFIPSL